MLCGGDPITGKDYEYRREWIRDRLEFLAGAYGIDVLSFSVMHNHVHGITAITEESANDFPSR
jgi:REP element-mobilizing transposase RayT